MDESAPRAPAHSNLALKAAQASLAEGLIHLRVASTVHPRLGKVSPLLGVLGFRPGVGGGHGGRPVQFVFFGGLGSGNSLCTILPSASTGDYFTVIPGLEVQVTSPLASAQGEAYDGRYGILQGELPRGSPAGRFGDLRSLTICLS